MDLNGRFDLLRKSLTDLSEDCSALIFQKPQNEKEKDLKVLSVVIKCFGLLSLIFSLSYLSSAFASVAAGKCLFHLTLSSIGAGIAHDCLVIGHNARKPLELEESLKEQQSKCDSAKKEFEKTKGFFSNIGKGWGIIKACWGKTEAESKLKSEVRGLRDSPLL